MSSIGESFLVGQETCNNVCTKNGSNKVIDTWCKRNIGAMEINSIMYRHTHVLFGACCSTTTLKSSTIDTVIVTFANL